MVEVDGRPVPSCTHAARDGLVVVTESARLANYRRDLGEMMLAESAPGNEVAQRLSEWGSTGTRYARLQTRAADASHAILNIDLDACILCRRCVRACEEVQGQFVWAVMARGGEAHLGWEGRTFADSPCVSCGACAATCPTGAIAPQAGDSALVGPLTTTKSTCGYCGVGCQIHVRTVGDRVVSVDGAASPVNRAHLCVKGRYAFGWQRSEERLTVPLIRRNGVLEPASWEAAIALVAREMGKGRAAGLSSARCTNEENYLFQKWMRVGLGTNDVDCCARVCHAPSAAGMRRSLGTGAATNALADIERADLIMVVGANPTEAHPITGARIKQAVLRGAKLLVLDPRRIELAELADIHLAVRPGTNVLLFNALACALVEGGFVRSEWVEQHAEGWDAYREWIVTQTPQSVAKRCGISAADIREAARLYGEAERPMMVHGLGVTEHFQGSESVTLLCNLALLVGAIGREGVGVNPLRGQNNVQGAADMGAQPDLLPGYAAVADPSVRDQFASVWGRPLPDVAGRTLPEMLAGAVSGDVKRMFILGEDIVQTDPHSAHIRAALDALDFLVVQEMFLSETAMLADVVLPAAGFLEKEGTFTNGERRIQRVRRAVSPPGTARADWQIIAALMEASGLPAPYGSPAEIMDEIARVVPTFAGVHYERLAGDGLQWPVPSLAHPGTPILHQGAFRGHFQIIDWTPSPSHGGPLTLVTGRRLEHYNCGTMTRRSRTISLADHDTLDLHPTDASARGIKEGDRVEVRSDSGVIEASAHLTEMVRAGMVFLTFHFPETHANALTGDVRDRWTGCPEYKVTGVEIRRIEP